LKMRLLLKYSRKGPARYISHLDMQRAFGRALRRADIDVEYSKGFNPHIIMSFASPLSVGYATEADYLELSVNSGEAGDIMERLNGVFTKDIRVGFVGSLEHIKEKLMSLSHSAAYRLVFALENDSDCVKIKKAADEIVGCGSYVVADSKGRERDIVPLVLEADVRGPVIELATRNSSSAAMNPRVFADAVLEKAGVAAGYCTTRTECYAQYRGEVLPFSGLCGPGVCGG